MNSSGPSLGHSYFNLDLLFSVFLLLLNFEFTVISFPSVWETFLEGRPGGSVSWELVSSSPYHGPFLLIHYY